MPDTDHDPVGHDGDRLHGWEVDPLELPEQGRVERDQRDVQHVDPDGDVLTARELLDLEPMLSLDNAFSEEEVTACPFTDMEPVPDAPS